jgi:hypothetical protein
MDEEDVKQAKGDAAALSNAKNDALRNYLALTRALPVRTPFNEATVDATRERLGEKLTSEASADVTLFSKDAPVDISLLIEVGLQTVFRSKDSVQSETGIVIAGYL